MMLHISTAGGKQFDVSVEGGETTAMLKKKVFELMSEDPEQAAVPCSLNHIEQPKNCSIRYEMDFRNWNTCHFSGVREKVQKFL